MARFPIAVLCAGLVFLSACSTTPKATSTESVPVSQPTLATSVRLACLDLAKYGKRIEKKDVERFAAAVKQEQIEILAVQGITRYPNVKTRIDFVSEFASRSDMRHVFGESTDIMGRQTGNAVFSVFPIRSNQKKEFDVPSAFSEYALHVAIDAGLRDVAIVSTWLPANAPPEDVAKCVRTINDLRPTPETPFIVSGNLPGVKQTRNAEIYTDVQLSLPEGSARQISSRLWYAQRELFKLIQARTVKTDFGVLTVADFGLFQEAQKQERRGKGEE